MELEGGFLTPDEPPNGAHNHKCPDCGKVWGCEYAPDKDDWERWCPECLDGMLRGEV